MYKSFRRLYEVVKKLPTMLENIKLIIRVHIDIEKRALTEKFRILNQHLYLNKLSLQQKR